MSTDMTYVGMPDVSYAIIAGLDRACATPFSLLFLALSQPCVPGR